MPGKLYDNNDIVITRSTFKSPKATFRIADLRSVRREDVQTNEKRLATRSTVMVIFLFLSAITAGLALLPCVIIFFSIFPEGGGAIFRRVLYAEGAFGVLPVITIDPSGTSVPEGADEGDLDAVHDVLDKLLSRA